MFKLKSLVVICFGTMLTVGLTPIAIAQALEESPTVVLVPNTTGGTGSEANTVLAVSEDSLAQTTGGDGDQQSFSDVQVQPASLEIAVKQLPPDPGEPATIVPLTLPPLIEAVEIEKKDLPITGSIMITNGPGAIAKVMTPGINFMKSKNVSPSTSYTRKFTTFLSSVNPSGVNLPMSLGKTALIIEKGGKVCVPVITFTGTFSADRNFYKVFTTNGFTINSLGCLFLPSAITYLERMGGVPVTAQPTSAIGAPAAKVTLTITVP